MMYHLRLCLLCHACIDVGTHLLKHVHICRRQRLLISTSKSCLDQAFLTQVSGCMLCIVRRAVCS